MPTPTKEEVQELEKMKPRVDKMLADLDALDAAASTATKDAEAADKVTAQKK